MNEKEQQLYEYYKNNIDFSKNKLSKNYDFTLIINELLKGAYKDFPEMLVSYIQFINTKEKKEKRQDYFDYEEDFCYEILCKKREPEHNDFKINWLYKKEYENSFTTFDTILRDNHTADDFYRIIEMEMFRFINEEILHFVLLGFLFLNTDDTIEQVKEKMYKVFININTIENIYFNGMYRYNELFDFYNGKEKLTNDEITYDKFFNNWEIDENTKKGKKENK